MDASYTPLHPGFGVEVHGVSLDGDTRTGELLQEALDTHRLLLFRETALSDEAQVELMRCFGEPTLENPHRDALHAFVSNAREDGILGEGAYAFHSDHAFMPDPIEYLSLAAIEVSPGCGATRFADMVGAAASLPPELRAGIEGRSGQNIIDPSGEPGEVRMRAQSHAGLPQAAHAALAPHPRTGAETLFVNEQQTEFLSDLPRDESDALLEALFAHLYQDAHVYVHEWQPGDLIVWDNQALQHARPRLDPKVPRTLRRVSVGGSSVFEFFQQADGPMHRLEEQA
jgi:taurine dioxygenase